MSNEEPTSEVEYSEGLALAGLEEQFDAGDGFSLVEAIAICHANDWPFPDWVNQHLGQTMFDLFLTLFPKAQLDQSSKDRIRPIHIPRNDKELADRFRIARDRTVTELGLKQQGTSVIEKS